MRSAEIRTLRVSKEAFSPRLSVVALLEPDPHHVARVGARAAGRVVSIDVALGERVRKGQPLAEVETVETHEVASKYLTAAARAKEANDVLERQRQLVKERVGAVQDLRRAESNADAANAALREAEEHLRFLGLSNQAVAEVRTGNSRAGERSIVRAPIDGRVASLSASLGQVVAGTEDVLTIVNSDQLWATLRIYERDLAGVTVGSTVELKVPSYPDRTFRATLELVGEVVDPTTHTVEARAKLRNPEGILKPGMTATAGIALKSSDATLWLPIEAVQPRGSDRVVFLRVKERRFEPRRVNVGVERNGFVAVTSGLAEGTEVVVHGAWALRGELERAEIQGE
jgi:cobalt-zinc-cadmium efflux system membrane fusion protein